MVTTAVVPNQVFDDTHIGLEILDVATGSHSILYGGNTLLSSGTTYPLTAQTISTSIGVFDGATTHSFTIPVAPVAHESYTIVVSGTAALPVVTWCQDNYEQCNTLL